jgi:hypothetical protein
MMAALITVALLGQTQAPASAGPLIDRWEARADRLEARLSESTREQGRIADFFERLSNREGKGLLDRFDGSRIATVARGIYWMVMACIGAVTVAAAAVAAKYVGEAVKAWKGKP